MLQCCSLPFYQKIAESLKKLSNSGLQSYQNHQNFGPVSEMLISGKFLVNFNAFIKDNEKYVFPKTLIDTKYKCQKKKVKLENSM